MDSWIIKLHDFIGEIPFLVISLITAVTFCFWLIPYTTDLMVSCAAGLAGDYLGREQRTLVINSSTNNPELLLMLVSLGLGRLGGIATPLGSNFANIYLMFIVAPLFVLFKWFLRRDFNKILSLITLINREKKLVIWHSSLSLTMFGFASIAYWCLTGGFQFNYLSEDIPLRTWHWLLIGVLICIIGIGIFVYFENNLKKKRPGLFEDITEEDFESNWFKFIVGTTSLTGLCYILNSLFLAYTELYSSVLSQWLGSAVFVGLHYFIGSLISSLPEANVAIKNYERLSSPDLNTALASASQSNMTNLALGCLGCTIATILLLTGLSYKL
ncbi:MAG: hypothetical protein F6J90_09100 [Moorea sp. SIOASIH]|nr:hypothetical protein [Moorena sp. SIOASIH]NEO91656.1 hypothetical protein [Moorena sp. SIO3G5]